MGRSKLPYLRLCEMRGCTNRHYAKGQCRLHYFRSWRIKNRSASACDEQEASAKIRLIASSAEIAHKKADGFAPPASSPSYEPMYEDRRIGYDNHVEQ